MLVARVDHRDVVCMKPRVSRDQRESFLPRLSDEQPVERITVMKRKARDGEAMVRGQSEHTQTGAEDVCVKVARHRELADRCLRPDLSERDDAERELRGRRDRLAGTYPEPLHARELPEHDVRVEQQPHSGSSSIASISSSENSKSSPIEIDPARLPCAARKREPGVAGSTRTSRATGTPSRAISTSSPASTRARSFERSVFACPTFTRITRG